jgi:DNA primase
MTIQYNDFLSSIDRAEDKGRYITGLCPFHSDSSPSLLIFKDGWWRCLGCGKNGAWIDLWNKIKGQPVHIQAEKKTRWSGPLLNGESLDDIYYQSHLDLLNYPSLGWYITETRKLQDRIEPCEIGYRDGWYTVPVFDIDHTMKTVVFRAAPHVQEVTGMKYWCNARPPVMYVPDWRLYESGDFLVVCFGIFDALAISDLRYPVVTSTAGKDTFKADWLMLVRKPIYIIPDSGEEDTAIRLANNLGWRGHVIKLNYPVGSKDPADYFKNGKKEELRREMTQLK